MENLIGLYVWHLVVLRSRWSAVVFASLTTLLQDTEELHLLSKLPEQFIQCFASFIYLFILTRHCKIEWWTCRYFLNAGYSVIFLYRRFAFLLSSFLPCSKQFPLSFFIIKWKQYDFICTEDPVSRTAHLFLMILCLNVLIYLMGQIFKVWMLNTPCISNVYDVWICRTT